MGLLTEAREFVKSRWSPTHRFRRDLRELMEEPNLRRRYWRSWALARRYGCYIAPSAQVSSHAVFPHPVGIVIGEGAVVGDGCIIYQHVTLGRRHHDVLGTPTLGQDCVVYAGAVLVGEIELAERTVVGANSVVTRSCSHPGVLLAGAPAAPVSVGSSLEV